MEGDRRFKAKKKEERNRVDKDKSIRKKKRKGFPKKKPLIDTPCESNIVVEEDVSPENVHSDVVYDEIPSTSQTVEQIEIIPEVILPEVSELNVLVMTKKQGDKIEFSPKKDCLERGRQTHHCCRPITSHRLMDPVIK